MSKAQAVSHDSGGGRRARGPRVTTSLAEINVVPLVDVMLVLLIIFMVTAPMMQRGVDVKLPTSRRSAPISSEPLFVTVPLSYRTDRRVRLGQDTIPVAVLAERLRQAMLTQSEKKVFLNVDGALSAQDIMDVFDLMKDGGVQDVGFVTAAPTR
ncbi:MAG TPA: biopolymer transporter ExbD [Vicinamibacterales bacterium]|jgi:biopolymer transport protein ExbD|nr:biopolymer transporter ExbD [Vicinamibacterales bacterium]